jgi:hypothetical protein
MNSTFQRDHEAPRSYEGEYVTDVIAQKAYRLLDEAIRAREQPFFLTIAPSAPHVNIEMNGNPFDDDFEVIFSAPIAAERHQDLFSDEKVPRAKNFNPDLVCASATECLTIHLSLLAIRSQLGAAITETKSRKYRLQ